MIVYTIIEVVNQRAQSKSSIKAPNEKIYIFGIESLDKTLKNMYLIIHSSLKLLSF
jgi:hypothetical protein